MEAFMEHNLFSENMIKFYEMFREDTGSARECALKLEKAIPLIADDLQLGKYVISLFAPPSLYDGTGTTVEHVLYTYEEGHEVAFERYEYATGEHGRVVISAYPRKGCTWSDDEKSVLSTVSLNVFFLCGRARLIDMMKKTTITDNATGIDNVIGFMKYASEVSYKIGLEKYNGIRFNIKNFSVLNKSFSKIKSAEILRAYCNNVKNFIGNNGIVARLGGDNFVCLVKKEFLDYFLNFIIDVPIKVDPLGKVINVGARVGVCNIEHSDNIGMVMEYLDVVIGIAKYEGKDIVFFEREMIEKVNKEKVIIASFPQALSNGEFHVYFQPKVDTKDNTLCGCEALVRWIRDGKVISPMEFIPILEEDSSVCELDFYVFEESMRLLRSWLDKGYAPIRVSVNFSKLHLKNLDTTDKIFEIIEKYDIDESLVEIELTEMSGYDNFNSLSEFVNKLKERGVHTSIDDFGTGYSSLNLLTGINVDVVKLDKSFLDCVEDKESKKRILLHNIVEMVHELEYSIIAEGVETDEQAEFLKEIGCSMVQGYLYDKPLPALEFEERIKNESYYN